MNSEKLETDFFPRIWKSSDFSLLKFPQAPQSDPENFWCTLRVRSPSSLILNSRSSPLLISKPSFVDCTVRAPDVRGRVTVRPFSCSDNLQGLILVTGHSSKMGYLSIWEVPEGVEDNCVEPKTYTINVPDNHMLGCKGGNLNYM